MERINKIPPKQMYYLDESGFNIDMQREYGYHLKSKRLLAERSGNRKNKRISVVGVRDLEHNLLYSFHFKGSMNKQLFKKYLEEKLLPFLPKNSYLIMDNTSFHKGKDIENLINLYKINLIYLPPYSPDLNPIEKNGAK